ncbi:FMN-binding negative transcriptional regulator [Rhodohalobacter sulfatireducens]|uniref:FMN-binding negative transcriptional regulator n=1 Tax=Rhodohalobacter sulfatireducens TaxID=2911366 RepID=A0ABS9KJ56_9BACT|nr:FMN-binding negative transcriptional regulator [Rhodohalobacter sulfatireducens]MCG2590856.1 FMN-binding negative transcriptional regulator [Rhodohalobacter sulfatireducens]
MYSKKRYLKKNRNHIFNFIVNHPFATFVLNGDRLLGTHIPILAEGQSATFRLFGHISDHFNEQKKYLKDGVEALLIFHGPQAYVSSSWYQKNNISTWDYAAVHVNAKITVQTDDELESSLKKLVHRFEKDQEKPLFFDEIPKKMIDDHFPHITGFWAEPFHIEGVAKLHQGYKEEDVESTIKHLEEQNDPAARCLAESIKKEHGK